VLFVSAIAREIKKRNAHAEIVLYTDHPDAAMDNSDYTGLRESREFHEICQGCDQYDRFIDLDQTYERRPNLHIIDAYAEVCGLDKVEKILYVNPGDEGRERANEMWFALGNPDKVAVIHPHIGQTWLGRNPRTDLFDKVNGYLISSGWKTVVLGLKRTYFGQCTMDSQGCTTLRQAFGVVARANLFFGVDSALMNVSQASGVPTVGIFGCMNPEHILLPVPWVTALTANPMKVGCLGCHERYEVGSVGRPGRCMRETDVCMEKIELYDAVKAIEKVLESKK
jgi:ADP-heptose:LPS heptosyltransferase